MMRLAIVGAGELGCLIAHHATTDGHYRVVGFYDDRATTATREVAGGEILGTIADVLPAFREGKFDHLMIGIGYASMEARRRVFEQFVSLVPLGQLIHSSCYVDPTVEIGRNVVLLPGCIVDFGSQLEDNATLQVGCVIAHHSTIGAHAFLGPAVRTAGFVKVEAAAFVGLGAAIRDGVTIGTEAIVGAGAVVVGDVAPRTVVVGVPARPLRRLSKETE